MGGKIFMIILVFNYIKNIGRMYFITAVQIKPTLILYFSFKTGMTFSAP